MPRKTGPGIPSQRAARKFGAPILLLEADSDSLVSFLNTVNGFFQPGTPGLGTAEVPQIRLAQSD